MKQIITLSDKAATRIKEVLSKDEKSLGVRIGVKSGGCAGMEYVMVCRSRSSYVPFRNRDGL